MHDPEVEAVIKRYARRDDSSRYGISQPGIKELIDERRLAVLRFLAKSGWNDLPERRLLEVGCGEGNVLTEMIQLGFAPEHLIGIEVLSERLAQAQRKLPRAVELIGGDACTADVERSSQDIVAQFVVFSSLLDDGFQQRLASAMWRWVRPGGAVLWYDLAVNNPFNPDVRGISLARIRALFPAGRVAASRVTLLPPLARAVCRVHPGLYRLLNVVPFLRTHVLAWIQKPEGNPA